MATKEAAPAALPANLLVLSYCKRPRQASARSRSGPFPARSASQTGIKAGKRPRRMTQSAQYQGLALSVWRRAPPPLRKSTPKVHGSTQRSGAISSSMRRAPSWPSHTLAAAAASEQVLSTIFREGQQRHDGSYSRRTTRLAHRATQGPHQPRPVVVKPVDLDMIVPGMKPGQGVLVETDETFEELGVGQGSSAGLEPDPAPRPRQEALQNGKRWRRQRARCLHLRRSEVQIPSAPQAKDSELNHPIYQKLI